jgi:hypothetical protein
MRESGDPVFQSIRAKAERPLRTRSPVKPGDDVHYIYFFLTTFGFGSGLSACGSKPI